MIVLGILAFLVGLVALFGSLIAGAWCGLLGFSVAILIAFGLFMLSGFLFERAK